MEKATDFEDRVDDLIARYVNCIGKEGDQELLRHKLRSELWRLKDYVFFNGVEPGVPGVQKVKPSELLEKYRFQIKKIALSHNVTNVRVFGSVARGEDTVDSDLDLLVTAIHGVTTLFDLDGICNELEELLNVHVDVVTDTVIPEKDKVTILSEAIEL